MRVSTRHANGRYYAFRVVYFATEIQLMQKGKGFFQNKANQHPFIASPNRMFKENKNRYAIALWENRVWYKNHLLFLVLSIFLHLFRCLFLEHRHTDSIRILLLLLTLELRPIICSHSSS